VKLIPLFLSVGLLAVSVRAEERPFVLYSIDDSLEWYKKNEPLWTIKAEQGDAGAQNSLAIMYSSEGATKNVDKAIKLWAKVAEHTDPADNCFVPYAQYMLGYYSYYGEGVTKNKKEAVKWWTKAAQEGSREAQYALGFCYNYGEGVAKDIEEAIKWYTKAAENGNSNAIQPLKILNPKWVWVMRTNPPLPQSK